MRSLETASIQTLTAQIRTNPELICKFNLGTDGFIDSCNYTIDVVDYRKLHIIIIIMMIEMQTWWGNKNGYDSNNDNKYIHNNNNTNERII